MEQGVASRIKIFGFSSVEVLQATEKLTLLYNSLAMSSLYKERYKLALDLLSRARRLTKKIDQLLPVQIQTLNNLACCYRRMKQPEMALSLLRQALHVLSKVRGDKREQVCVLSPVIVFRIFLPLHIHTCVCASFSYAGREG